MTTSIVGRIYKFKVIAENYSGVISTNALSVAYASLPSKPLNPPISNPSITDQSNLGIVIELFTSANNGGSEIQVYEIQYDDGNSGNFTSVY